jgi:protein TonB
MNLIFHRFSGSLLAVLAAKRAELARFQRLLRDRPTGIRVQTRQKNPALDLKPGYRKRLALSAAVSCLLAAVSFLTYPERHPTVVLGRVPPQIIQIEHIPQTSQTRTPAPPRPVVPLAVEGDEVPEDVTIETTELDFDSIPIDLRISGPVAMGPPSDEPLDISEIEFKPHPIRITTPEYPREARKAKIEGSVVVKVLVDKQGKVERVEVVSGPEIFRQAALEAARQFRFRPGRHEGERRKVWMVMPIDFKLR